jgi:Flp pilus assembly CpaE family ATPase
MITSKFGDDLGMAHSEASGPGSIFAFLPAHSDSRAGAVAQQLSRTLSEGLGVTVLLADFDRRAYSVWSATEAPRRLDERTWGAFVSEVDGIPVLNAREVEPRQLGRLIDYARRHFHIVCADLTGARESHAAEVLRAADSVFLVTGSDGPSLEGVRQKLEWLRSLNLADECGLLLEHTPHGVTAADAEEITGVPVCSVVETAAQIEQLATWLSSNSLSSNALALKAIETARAV